jgi:predicted nucleotidyltransferase
MNVIEDGLFDATRKLRSWAQGRDFVRRLWVFGSRVRGLQRPDSAFDAALEIDPVGRDELPLVSWMAHHSKWVAELTAVLP